MPAKKSKPNKLDFFVGRWIAADQWETDIALIVSKRSGKIRVSAVDQSDGEKAEIFDLKVKSAEISFAAYWSSGQLTKYRLRILGIGQMEVVFTFTDTTNFKKTSA